MKRYGFVLIELMISFLIGAIMATGLLTSIMQMSKVQETITTLTSVYGRIAIVQNQIERDIMGAFVPAQTDMIETSTEKKEQPKALDKVFYGTSNEGGRFQLLTCITSSPLEMFFGVKNAKLKPRVARVVYRLVPDEQRKNSFKLMRQEGTSSLYFDKYKEDSSGELRSFAIIDGIQNFVVSYVSIEQPKKSDDEKEQKRLYKKSPKWDSTPKKEEAPKKDEAGKTQDAKKTAIKKEPIKLPNQIECELSLWDSTHQSIKTFKYTIPIAYKASEYETPPEVKEKKPKDDGKEVEGGGKKEADKEGADEK